MADFGIGEALLLGGALAAGGAATSAFGSMQQNSAIRRSQASANTAASAAMKQQADNLAIERQKRINTAQLIDAKLRVAAGESGAGDVGSYAALERQGAFDAGINDKILRNNYANNIASIQSGLQAQQLSLSSQIQNSVIAGTSGALKGFSTGLSLGQGIGALGSLNGGSVVGDANFPAMDPNARVGGELS